MVSLGAHQDDEAAAGQSLVVGAGDRDAKGHSAWRGVGGPGAGSPSEEPATLRREEAPPRAARLAEDPSAGTRTECAITRDHGHAGRRYRRQEDPPGRAGKNGAPAHAAVSGEQGAQKLPVEETTPRGKEAQAATRPDAREESTTSRRAGGQTSGHAGTTAGTTGGQRGPGAGATAGTTSESSGQSKSACTTQAGASRRTPPFA